MAEGLILARKSASSVYVKLTNGRVSDDYFYMVLDSEYSEFKTPDDEWMCYIHNDVHPFSSEGLGQD